MVSSSNYHPIEDEVELWESGVMYDPSGENTHYKERPCICWKCED
jgi:hypothetical protein